MERHFDEELSELKKEILTMSALAQEAIRSSVEALKELSVPKAQAVVADDQKIDELELKIEETCMDFLALRQPMATDLRFIVMAMKITNELERMADLAVDIAQRALQIAGQPLLKPLVDIPELASLSQKMISEVIASFIDKNSEQAARVIQMDQRADELRNRVQKELVDDFMAKDPGTASRAVPLLLAARHLERICDHATNIAEDVIYLCSATVVKHHPEKLEDKS
ncbi:MAG: phosphate signaling complex protein PhoU [Candidatus Omnitrophota bacterium]